jgi:hypothetical protein
MDDFDHSPGLTRWKLLQCMTVQTCIGITVTACPRDPVLLLLCSQQQVDVLVVADQPGSPDLPRCHCYMRNRAFRWRGAASVIRGRRTGLASLIVGGLRQAAAPVLPAATIVLFCCYLLGRGPS